MDNMIEILLLDYEEDLAVEGGWLHISGFPVFRVTLEIARPHRFWEDLDILGRRLQLDDEAGNRWEASNVFPASALWLDRADGDITSDNNGFTYGFKEQCLLNDVYEINDSRLYRHFVIDGKVVEVHPKYLACHYDVAYTLDKMANGDHLCFSTAGAADNGRTASGRAGVLHGGPDAGE